MKMNFNFKDKIFELTSIENLADDSLTNKLAGRPASTLTFFFSERWSDVIEF